MWWEATVSGGDIGFGVLFKRVVKEEEETTKATVDTITPVQRVDTTKTDIK